MFTQLKVLFVIKLNILFKLEKFLTDSDYATQKIQAYEANKSMINILDVLNTIPHIKAMLSAMMNAKRIVEEQSAKGGLSNEFLMEVKTNVFPFKALPTNATSIIYKFIDQISTFKFLKEHVKDITIKNVNERYDLDYSKIQVVDRELSLDFNNYSDVMTYKIWFENVFCSLSKEFTYLQR